MRGRFYFKALLMFGMQILLLGFMLVGFIVSKARIVDEHSRSSMTSLVLGVFLPCNILSSFFGTDRSQLPSMGIIMAISLGTLALSYLLSRFFYFRAGSEQKKVLLYATMIPNAAFLGNPVIQSIYGIEALTYASIYLIPIRVALLTAGIAIFSGGKGSIKRVIFHPCLLATYAGILVMITGFIPPDLVSRFVFALGNCSTPFSMMVVGSVLSMVEPKKLVTGLSVYYSFIRLVFIPLLTMGVLLLLRTEPLIAGVSVVLSGTPAAVTTSILADKYNADKGLASRIAFLSTLLSIITIPVLVWLLTHI